MSRGRLRGVEVGVGGGGGRRGGAAAEGKPLHGGPCYLYQQIIPLREMCVISKENQVLFAGSADQAAGAPKLEYIAIDFSYRIAGEVGCLEPTQPGLRVFLGTALLSSLALFL